ncbi:MULTISPECIES: hypothetical protein [Bacillus]|uniref:hypothetical protein n=1 Tax=Bacillus TaxID=1386 RepID=UPI00030A25F3|nr:MULTISPECIES: hypothetical protein [Bacillus]
MRFLKKYWFAGTMMIIFISWISNSVYFESKQLKEPIILPSYIVQSPDSLSYMTLYYLDNKNEQEKNNTLQIVTKYAENQEPAISWNSQLGYITIVKEYRHHYLKKVLFELRASDIEQLHEQKNTLQNVAISFPNGKSFPANIRQFHLLRSTEGTQYLDFIQTSNSTQGITEHTFAVKEDVTMNEIKLPKPLANGIEVSILTKTSQNALLSSEINWPLSFQKKDIVKIILKKTNSKQQASSANIHVIWSGTSNKGNNVQQLILLNAEPSLSQNQVNELVKRERGAQE